MLHLATEAERMMSASQPVIEPPVRLYGPPLTDHVSRFTLLGAVGPDLPRYAAYFVPGKDWLFNTLHKGTPDENRERVLVHSTELVFDFWRRVGPLIDGEFSESGKRDEATGQDAGVCARPPVSRGDRRAGASLVREHRGACHRSRPPFRRSVACGATMWPAPSTRTWPMSSSDAGRIRGRRSGRTGIPRPRRSRRRLPRR